MGKVQKRAKQTDDLPRLVEASTKKNGVPLKVQDAATIEKLRLLVSAARQSQRALDRISTASTFAAASGRDGLSRDQQAA